MFLFIHSRRMDKGNRSISRPLKQGHLFLARPINNPSSVLAALLSLHNPVGTNLGAFMLLGEL